MAAKRRWLWMALFIWVVILLGILAAGWNFVLVQDYRQIMELARAIARPGQDRRGMQIDTRPPWPAVVFGTLGFLAAVGVMAGIFVRLLNEMRLNQLQAEFLAAVSHELKTPLASLELTSSLLRERRRWIRRGRRPLGIARRRAQAAARGGRDPARGRPLARSRHTRSRARRSSSRTGSRTDMIRWRRILGPRRRAQARRPARSKARRCSTRRPCG